jgi:hypothetical protein
LTSKVPVLLFSFGVELALKIVVSLAIPKVGAFELPYVSNADIISVG